MNIMNNEASTTATDMHNMASDTQQAGTGIGQSSPNIDLDATTGPSNTNNWDYTPHIINGGKSFQETAEQNKKLIEERKEQERTHGDIMSEINKNESLVDKINELLDLEMNRSEKNLSERSKLFRHLQQLLGIKTWDELTTSKSELLNSIKELKEHENFDNRTDAEKRIDQLLKDQRDREDTAAQRGTQDMLKAGLHPASANYGGSVGGSSGGSSGGGGGSGGSESEKEKERRRRRKKLLEERKRAREREKRQNVMNLLSRMGSAATYGGMRAALYKPKSMNNPTTNAAPKQVINNNKVKMNEPDWLNEYLDEIKEMKPVNEYKKATSNREKEDREIYNRLMKKQ